MHKSERKIIMNHQAIKMDDKVIGIYDKDSNNLAYFHSDTPDSPFSNLYQPKNGFNLYAYNGKMQVNPAKGAKTYHFNSVEQVFAFGKALSMHDKESAKKIYQTNSYPAIYRKLGRSVKNFDPQVWQDASTQWMKLGMLAKFSQDPYCRKALKATKGINLVEANPYDRTWGIGKNIHQDFGYYQAQNKQGQTLMKVRQELGFDQGLRQKSQIKGQNISDDSEFGD